MKKKNLIRLQDITFGTIAVSSLLVLLGASGAFAATSAVDEVTITVPASCSLTNTVGTAHTATIETGVYQDDIGETTINAFCNDSEGFSVYAVGYTDDTFGNNTMKPSTLADTNAIATGLATSGDTSNWAMKLTSLSDNYTLTNDFNAYHLVPDEYTKVATYPSNTTTTAGVNIKSTYAAYISQTQPADTYTGKVKYTIVHPSNADAPAAPAMLGTGQNVNAKMKNLANNSSNADKYTYDSEIKAFRRSDTLPNNFIATSNNTISIATSSTPIYIFFDNTNDEGIMYYYAKDADIIANSDSSIMFYNMNSLTDIAGLSDWNTANVTSMNSMFYSTKITSLDALTPNKNNNPNVWNTGNVTDMAAMLSNCSSLTDITGLSNWNTASVTNMSGVFYNTKITSLDALAPNKNNNPNIWNTGNVTNLGYIFNNCSLLTDITGLSDWDTTSVTSMNSMFQDTKITSLDALAPNKNNNPNIWNTGNVTDMRYMFNNCSSLTNITSIASWNISKVTATVGNTLPGKNYFYQIFNNVPSTATSGFVFTNRAGSLNSDGTYVTSN